jgi:hypothetical protein
LANYVGGQVLISIVFRVKRETLAVNHLIVLRHVANFNVDQQRFKRKREDYAAPEFKRMTPLAINSVGG